MTTILQDQWLFFHPNYGVRLALYPSSDRSFDLELSRAYISSTHTFSVIAPRISPINSGAYTEYVDRVPNIANTPFFYKMRSVKDGWTASAYTTAVKATPVLLGAGKQPQLPLTGGGITRPIYISTGVDLNAGTQGSPSAITKTMRFWSDVWSPVNSLTDDYSLAGTPPVLEPGTANANRSFVASLTLPRGVTVKGVTIAYVRNNANSTATVVITKATSTSGATTLKTLTGTTGSGYRTMATSTLSVVVTSTNMITLNGKLRSGTTAATLANAGFLYVDVQYTMSAYQQAY